MGGTLIAALLEFPTQEHVNSVCKLGQGEQTCRYLTSTGGKKQGWTCEKSGSLRRILDERVAYGTMNAKGDNCGGLLELILENQKELVGKQVKYEETTPTYRSAGPFKRVEVKSGMCRIFWDDHGKEKDVTINLDYLNIDVSPGSISFGVSGLGSFAGTTNILLSEAS